MDKPTLEKLLTEMYEGMLTGQSQFKHYQNKQNEGTDIKQICSRSK